MPVSVGEGLVHVQAAAGTRPLGRAGLVGVGGVEIDDHETGRAGGDRDVVRRVARPPAGDALSVEGRPGLPAGELGPRALRPGPEREHRPPVLGRIQGEGQSAGHAVTPVAQVGQHSGCAASPQSHQPRAAMVQCGRWG